MYVNGINMIMAISRVRHHDLYNAWRIVATNVRALCRELGRQVWFFFSSRHFQAV